LTPGNIIPSAGTYNMVSKIDTELSSLQSSVTTNTSDITTLLSGGTVFTANGGLGSTGIDGGDGATTSLAGVSCGGGGGMDSVNTSIYGTGGTGTFPGQDYYL